MKENTPDEQEPTRIVRDDKGRFVKGAPSPNPLGSKGHMTLTGKLRKVLESITKGDKESVADLVIASLIKAATKKGDINAIKEIFQRIDGKVPDKVEHTLSPGWEAIYEPFDKPEEEKQ